MKIKFKKEMTLDELIKWAWENPELVRGEKFYAQGKSNETYVYFHLYDGRKCILREYIYQPMTLLKSNMKRKSRKKL